MNTLLIAEHNNETLADATVKAVTAAAQMGGECHVLVAGSGCAAVADQAAKLDGVAKVLLADDVVIEALSGMVVDVVAVLEFAVSMLCFAKVLSGVMVEALVVIIGIQVLGKM